MANRRKWTAERRAKFAATLAAKKRKGTAKRYYKKPEPIAVNPVPPLPRTVEVLINGKIVECTLRSGPLYAARVYEA